MFAHSLAEFLDEKEYGTIDTDLFVNRTPSREDMDYVISVSDTTAYAMRSREMNTVEYGATVRIQGSNGKKVRKDIQDLYLDLENKQSFKDSDGNRFVLRPLNPPTFLMFDGAGRENWVLRVKAFTHNYSREE